MPFIRELSFGLQKLAVRNKNIFTLEDRFCRFDKWEPIDREWDKERKIFVYSEYEEIDGKDQIVKNPVPVLTLKQAKDHYLANRSRSLAENDPNWYNSEDFREFSKICPTLRSCISELNEYFLMRTVPL